jgi:hypothetical protein
MAEYNGWKNYETWCVALWLDNDRSTYEDVRYRVAKVVQDVDVAESFSYEVSEVLKSYIEDLAEMTCPGVIEGASFVSDLFSAALSEVHWHEIARNLIEELVESSA